MDLFMAGFFAAASLAHLHKRIKERDWWSIILMNLSAALMAIAILSRHVDLILH